MQDRRTPPNQSQPSPFGINGYIAQLLAYHPGVFQVMTFADEPVPFGVLRRQDEFDSQLIKNLLFVRGRLAAALLHPPIEYHGKSNVPQIRSNQPLPLLPFKSLMQPCLETDGATAAFQGCPDV